MFEREEVLDHIVSFGTPDVTVYVLLSIMAPSRPLEYPDSVSLSDPVDEGSQRDKVQAYLTGVAIELRDSGALVEVRVEMHERAARGATVPTYVFRPVRGGLASTARERGSVTAPLGAQTEVSDSADRRSPRAIHLSQLRDPVGRADLASGRRPVRHRGLAQLRCGLRSHLDGLAGQLRRGVATTLVALRRALSTHVAFLSGQHMRQFRGARAARVAVGAVPRRRAWRLRCAAMNAGPAAE